MSLIILIYKSYEENYHVSYGILFDDEKPNRESWKCGKAVNPCEDLIKAILENIR